MQLRWTPEAEQDRDAIWRYIAEDNPLAGVRMDELFSKAARKLLDFPEMGRAGLIQGTRELVPHENYRLIYEIHGKTVWIVALLHTSRQWPPE